MAKSVTTVQIIIVIVGVAHCISAATIALPDPASDSVVPPVKHRVLRQTISRQSSCANIGEYCKYHSDCCSGLCLSFSYKCVARTVASPFTPILSNSSPSGGSNVDLDNRFGAGSPTLNLPSRPAENDRCAAAGEYCKYSSDCCSKQCLSFSYKCVSNRPPISLPADFAGIHSSSVFEVGQRIPIDEITVEELANRFGESTSNATQVQTTAKPPQRPPLPPSPPAHRPIVSHHPNKGNCSANGQQCEFSNECCSEFCALASLNTRICSNHIELPTVPPPTLIENRCLVIGATCYTHAECCSQRCHIYLHQCVT